MNGRAHITDVDIKMYHLLFDAVSAAPENLAKTVPTFLINETIFFFENIEEYEKCGVLKKFFDRHPNKRLMMSRKDYFDFGWQHMSK
ncbi:MAG: hypothetical protein P8J32_03630 [bacterium]|nr:hypothetical protein [bacterium]